MAPVLADVTNAAPPATRSPTASDSRVGGKPRLPLTERRPRRAAAPSRRRRETLEGTRPFQRRLRSVSTATDDGFADCGGDGPVGADGEPYADEEDAEILFGASSPTGCPMDLLRVARCVFTKFWLLILAVVPAPRSPRSGKPRHRRRTALPSNGDTPQQPPVSPISVPAARRTSSLSHSSHLRDGSPAITPAGLARRPRGGSGSSSSSSRRATPISPISTVQRGEHALRSAPASPRAAVGRSGGARRRGPAARNLTSTIDNDAASFLQRWWLRAMAHVRLQRRTAAAASTIAAWWRQKQQRRRTTAHLRTRARSRCVLQRSVRHWLNARAMRATLGALVTVRRAARHAAWRRRLRSWAHHCAILRCSWAAAAQVLQRWWRERRSGAAASGPAAAAPPRTVDKPRRKRAKIVWADELPPAAGGRALACVAETPSSPRHRVAQPGLACIRGPRTPSSAPAPRKTAPRGRVGSARITELVASSPPLQLRAEASRAGGLAAGDSPLSWRRRAELRAFLSAPDEDEVAHATMYHTMANTTDYRPRGSGDANAAAACRVAERLLRQLLDKEQRDHAKHVTRVRRKARAVDRDGAPPVQAVSEAGTGGGKGAVPTRAGARRVHAAPFSPVRPVRGLACGKHRSGGALSQRAARGVFPRAGALCGEGEQ